MNEHKQFKNYAKAISQYLENSCIIGYGIYDFHLPILLNEFLRSNVEFDIRKIKVIDMKKLYEKLRPRTLTNALKDFFVLLRLKILIENLMKSQKHYWSYL